jgi:hypothetical protein
MIGKTLGYYQIMSQFGKGGMGEFYQTKDQKLGRDVAIKVLPEVLRTMFFVKTDLCLREGRRQ